MFAKIPPRTPLSHNLYAYSTTIGPWRDLENVKSNIVKIKLKIHFIIPIWSYCDFYTLKCHHFAVWTISENLSHTSVRKWQYLYLFVFGCLFVLFLPWNSKGAPLRDKREPSVIWHWCTPKMTCKGTIYYAGLTYMLLDPTYFWTLLQPALLQFARLLPCWMVRHFLTREQKHLLANGWVPPCSTISATHASEYLYRAST